MSAEIKGKVQRVWTHSSAYSTYDTTSPGLFMVAISGMPKACGHVHGFGRFVIDESHPLYETVVSIVLSAKATNSDVWVNYLDTCNIRFNSWDFGSISF